MLCTKGGSRPRNGNGIARDKLDPNRCVANPDNKNEEVYWNEDESKYYLIDWDKGIYKQVDPKEIPYLQENPQDPPRTEGDAPVVDLGGEPPAVEEDFVDDEQPIITEEELQRLQDLDPIGYTDSNGNTFDFVIDRNNDGVFNNASEFLGAIGNWSEMEKLDKDGNLYRHTGLFNNYQQIGKLQPEQYTGLINQAQKYFDENTK